MKRVLVGVLVGLSLIAALDAQNYPKARGRKSPRNQTTSPPSAPNQGVSDSEVTNQGDTVVFLKDCPVYTNYESLRNSDNPELSTDAQVASMRGLLEITAGTRAYVNQIRMHQGTFREKRGVRNGYQLWASLWPSSMEH